MLLALRDLGPAARALRPRIEHLQILQPADLPLLAATGAVASMQPVHATSDGPWVTTRLGAGTARLARMRTRGERLRTPGRCSPSGRTSRWRTPDPRRGSSRRRPGGPADGTPFAPEQAVSRVEALRAFTTGAAYASFAEGRRGRIGEGLDADLTLLAEDVLAVAPEALPRLTITHAIVAGRVTYERGR